MTQPIHIMLDLETWGTTPGCDIRSIGACAFDPVTGEVHGWNVERDDDGTGIDTFYIACDNPAVPNEREKFNTGYFDGVDQHRKYPLTRDPATVQWWSEQSDEAQAAFADPVDLADGLRQFGRWLSTVTGGDAIHPVRDVTCRLWSHGPAFDPPILFAAYRAVGLPVPWHYRAPRDTRTAFDMAGIEDHSAWLNQTPGPLGIPHHALDDAICQARAVCGAWARVQEWYGEYHRGASE